MMGPGMFEEAFKGLFIAAILFGVGLFVAGLCCRSTCDAIPIRVEWKADNQQQPETSSNQQE